MCMAWINIKTEKKWTKRLRDDFTTHQARFYTCLQVLEQARDADLEICTDSELLYRQFNGRPGVEDRCLRRFLDGMSNAIDQRRLKVRVLLIPRWENLARTLVPSTPTRPKGGKKS
jgi:hypothetical protein